MGDSEKRILVGRETVVLYTQAYKSFYMSHMLKLSIFGSPLFSYLSEHELIHSTINQTIVFIYSHRRMIDLFSFGDLDATTFYKDSLKYVCCAKANLQHRGRSTIGYVMDEDGDVLKVKIDEQNELVNVRRPEYDTQNWQFIYNNDPGANGCVFRLTQLWPIRMKLSKSGQSCYIISSQSYADDLPEYNNY